MKFVTYKCEVKSLVHTWAIEKRRWRTFAEEIEQKNRMMMEQYVAAEKFKGYTDYL